jgi:hypothetical protein
MITSPRGPAASINKLLGALQDAPEKPLDSWEQALCKLLAGRSQKEVLQMDSR